MTWKMFSGTARLYTVVFLICVGYASYSLARVLASPGKLREKASLTCDERRIESVRQTILLLLLLFGMTAANEAYRAFCGVPLSCPFRGDLDVVDGCGPWAIFTFTVFGALAVLHALQWIASVRLQRRASDISG
jgi:hypothetical protein